MPFPYLSNFTRTLPYKPHPFTGAVIQNIWEMGIKTTSLFTGVCLPECVYLGVLACQLSSLLKPGDAAQSYGPVL